MADNRLFSPTGVVAMGNALSSRMSRPNLYPKAHIIGRLAVYGLLTVFQPWKGDNKLFVQ